MSQAVSPPAARNESYGQKGLSLVDRLGVYLSRRAIVRQLPRGKRRKVLDLGCGYRATLLNALMPYAEAGMGVDFHIDPELKGRSRLTFLEDSIDRALPALPAEGFDLVLLISVLEHLGDPLTVLRHCQRILEPGGMLFINVPTWRGKFFLEFSAFRLGTSPALEMDDHKMYYDVRDLWPLLVAAGFKPSRLRLSYHKFGLNLFATAQKLA